MECLIDEVAPALREGGPASARGALFVKSDGDVYNGKNGMANLVQAGLKAAGVGTGAATARTARAATVTHVQDAGLPEAQVEAIARGMVRRAAEGAPKVQARCKQGASTVQARCH